MIFFLMSFNFSNIERTRNCIFGRSTNWDNLSQGKSDINAKWHEEEIKLGRKDTIKPLILYIVSGMCTDLCAICKTCWATVLTSCTPWSTRRNSGKVIYKEASFASTTRKFSFFYRLNTIYYVWSACHSFNIHRLLSKAIEIRDI